ncbi:MAG: hypothetical protein Q9160_004149 [Pyrenula sp. 1 TL-2023]
MEGLIRFQQRHHASQDETKHAQSQLAIEQAQSQLAIGKVQNEEDSKDTTIATPSVVETSLPQNNPQETLALEAQGQAPAAAQQSRGPTSTLYPTKLSFQPSGQEPQSSSSFETAENRMSPPPLRRSSLAGSQITSSWMRPRLNSGLPFGLSPRPVDLTRIHLSSLRDTYAPIDDTSRSPALPTSGTSADQGPSNDPKEEDLDLDFIKKESQD